MQFKKIEMARVIEYKDRKRYITDMKMGRNWMVLERRKGMRKARKRVKREQERPKDSGDSKEEKKQKRGGPKPSGPTL